ncbi:sigma factor-like helix-turn-helix DNA-binding protein [uncultured Tenacibaculum sp.]|uniref:sigma factor-like helix-turn-helix DNA-binding protein n=1 Tax=Tenacibaculum sp. A30 TaxID=3442644 RepID=UPI0026189739|nr:sigma factor-like helix-turn-helix DNA-binding protein [uncultured Tenacibaculum sp.]
MTIDEIYKKNEISIRTYHVCKYNKFNSIKDLKEYYFEHKSFDKLQNCGRKSNEELIEICNKYQVENFLNPEVEIKEGFQFKTIISNLTRVQRDVINSFILVNTNSLSVRSKNAVSLRLKNNFTIKNFAEKVFFNSVDIKHWKNVGAKSIPEIELYLSIIKDFVKDVSKSKEEKYLISLKNNFLIQRTFSISKIPKEILETESIFLLTDFLLNQNVLFDETQTDIIKKALKIYQNQKELTLDDIAEKVNLTRERVRQIRKLCIDNLFNKLLFIQNFNDDLHQKYGLDIENHHLEIDDDIIFKINNSNKTNFSKEFISYTVYVYLFNKYNLIGDIEDILQPTYVNSRKKHNWKNFYLINSKIANEVNFISMADDVDKRLNDRIEETYFFNFKSYLFKFLVNNNYSILNISLPVAEKIINDEFNLFLDLNDNIIFQRNTHKQVPEYIIEALEHLGEPSKLNEIYNWINRNYPEATKSEEALRGSCQRSNEIIYFGRSSTFGLKKWEKTRNDIKGGTIKDIITELLENSKTPLHITEILTEIHKYREKTNERNIITNLKLDPNNSFIIFNQKFIGLASQKNSYDLEKYRNLPIQLGKTIKGKIKKQQITDINQMSDFLNKNYDLTNKETKNILTSLNINL